MVVITPDARDESEGQLLVRDNSNPNVNYPHDPVLVIDRMIAWVKKQLLVSDVDVVGFSKCSDRRCRHQPILPRANPKMVKGREEPQVASFLPFQFVPLFS